MNTNVLLYVLSAVAIRLSFNVFCPPFQVKTVRQCPGSAPGECEQEFVGSHENLLWWRGNTAWRDNVVSYV